MLWRGRFSSSFVFLERPLPKGMAGPEYLTRWLRPGNLRASTKGFVRFFGEPFKKSTGEETSTVAFAIARRMPILEYPAKSLIRNEVRDADSILNPMSVIQAD